MRDRRLVIVATSQPELLRMSNSYETATADLLTRRDTLITRIDIDGNPQLVYWQRRRHG
jgi:hypothetical protein